MTDYTEQDIDQMIDEILEQPETVTKVCRKCGASFEAKHGSTRTLCPACFREARAANAKLGRAKLAREAAKKPGGGRTGHQGRGRNHRGSREQPGGGKPLSVTS